MSIDKFTRANEDISRSVTLTTDGSTAIDTSTLTAISVEVRHKKFKTVIGSYTLAASTVTKASPTSGGIITFIVSRTDTASQPVGVYEYEIETIETDSGYESSARHRSFVGDCFYLEHGILAGAIT